MKIALLFVVVSVCGAQSSDAMRWANYWADHYGLERELVYAVIETESGWNVRAISSAGAAGLMQLMPDTAATFGVRNRFEVTENIRGGVAYLKWLERLCGGDRRLMLASYNAGQGRVLRAGLAFDSEDVHAYVSRVAYLYRRNRWEAVLIARRGKEAWP